MKKINGKNEKILVIGLDGATPDLLFPWIESGKLPNLAKIIQNGASGELTSTIPPSSAPAWASFMTGKNPGKHGLYHFYEYKEGNIHLVNSSDIQARAIWSILSDLGKKVIVCHVPITYPPEKVNGILVSGLGTPGQDCDFAYPPELREELIELGYKIHAGRFFLKNVSNFEVKMDEQAMLKNLLETEQKRADIALHLMNKYPWDFFMVVFEGLDAVQHFFWKFLDEKHPAYDSKKAEIYSGAIEEVYKKVDKMIGPIIDNIDDDTDVVVLSDHGQGTLRKILCLNNWLVSRNLLKLKEDGTGQNSPNSFFKKLMGLLSKSKDESENSQSDDLFSIIDWSKSKAFSYGPMIFINTKEKNSRGIVSFGDEYDDLRDYLISETKKIVDPKTGQKIIRDVFKREEIYSGGNLSKAPDLVLFPDMSYLISPEIHDDLIRSINESSVKYLKKLSGNHRMNGILLMKGENIKKNKTLENMSIIDVAPTILFLMGVPIPDDMDGKPMLDALKSVSDVSPIYSPTKHVERSQKKDVSKEDEEKIKERLKMLGYMT